MRIYRFLLAVLLLIVICQLNCYADETITITTYYPSPYGSYNQLQVGSGTKKAAILDVEGGTATSGNGLPINLYAQSGAAVGSYNGGNIILMPGTATGSGTAGNVGIGTASPYAKLNVSTNVNYEPSLTPSTTNDFTVGAGIGGVNLTMGTSNNPPYAFWMQSQVGTSATAFPLSLNPLGGNVGIGTMNPLTNLHVIGPAFIDASGGGHGIGATYGLIVDGSGGILQLRDTGANTRLIINQTGTYFYYWNGNPLITIIQQGVGQGNVGIGTASPSSALSVNGNISLSANSLLGSGKAYDNPSSADSNTIQLYNGSTGAMTFTQGATNNTNYPINFVEDGANRLTITSGNVGIGTTSPQYTLDVIGDIRVTGSVWYGGTSGSANGTLYTKPDYVFSPGYKVMTVDAVESYLLKENHLPWMTPLKSEKKGAIDMTRMGFETVETAENLQLQIIFLNKKLKQQQKEIGAQKNRIGALNEKVDALEKDIKEIKKESH